MPKLTGKEIEIKHIKILQLASIRETAIIFNTFCYKLVCFIQCIGCFSKTSFLLCLLLRIFRHTDILGRFGGDEFIIFLPHPIEDEVVSTRAQDLLNLMQETIKIEDKTLDFHASIGIAKCPEDGTTYDEIMAKADKALYYAKKNGKNMYMYYENLPEDYSKSTEE